MTRQRERERGGEERGREGEREREGERKTREREDFFAGRKFERKTVFATPQVA